MRYEKTACRYCPGSCGLVATINDAGEVASLVGDKEDLLSRGFACPRGIQSAEALNLPSRILRPLKRLADGRFVEIDLETALDEVAARLRALIDANGVNCVALFNGTMLRKNVTANAAIKDWPRNLGTTRVFSTATIDQSSTSVAAQRLGAWNAGKQKLADSQVQIIFGGNPLISLFAENFTYDPVKRLKEAAARGFKLIVVDPRRSETAQSAHIHLQPRPGEDSSIAAGMIRLILECGWYDKAFCDQYAKGVSELRAAVEPYTVEYVAERADLDAGAFVTAVRLFAFESSRGIAACHTGTTMGPNSNLANHLVECLNVLCGRYLKEGDRVTNPGVMIPAREFRAEVIPPQREWEHSPTTSTGHGTINGEMMTGVLAHEILHGGSNQIRALLVNGANPAVAVPNQYEIVEALRSLDLLIAVEPFLTATARLCHYVFPPKLQAERLDTVPSPVIDKYYEVPYGRYVPPLVDPPSGAQVVDDWYVYWGLSKRLGVQMTVAGADLSMDDAPSTEQILQIALRNSRIPLDEIRRYPGGHIFDEEDVFVGPRAHDSTARFDLIPADVQEELRANWRDLPESMRAQPDRPYLLISRRLRGMYNSTGVEQPEVRRRHPFNSAYMNPKDLLDLGLGDRSPVRISSETGSIVALVEADSTLRPGIVSMTHCWGVLPDEPDDFLKHGAATSRLVDTKRDVQAVNAMPRMSSIAVLVEKVSSLAVEERGRAVPPQGT